MRKWGAAVAAVVTSTLVVAAASAPSNAASSGPARQTGKIVSQDAVDYTPDILGNEDPSADPPKTNTNSVYSIARVGNQIVVGGKFTQVVDKTTGTTLDRRNLFAFDAATGKVSETFNPRPDGQVDKVLAGRDGRSVFIGGAFQKVKGANAKRLAKLTVSSGALSSTFKPPALDGRVLDLESVGSRLWVAGRFFHVGSVRRGGIVALDPASGKRSSYFNMAFSGIHNASHPGGSQTFVKGIAVNPARTAVIAIGNFMSVAGKTRVQAAKFSLGRKAAGLSSWTTPQFRQRCKTRFETTMTDVEYAPSGSYFVISTTGGYGGLQRTETGISGCDVVARFPAGSNARGSRPSWTAYTGGDTTWTVEVTDNVVYVGGHQRWQNNPSAGDVNASGDAAGPGAVSRQGIAALNPVNGLPYSWNPTRRPGLGVQDMLATADGLYVGSDTDTFGHEPHAKLAFLPLAGGATLPAAVPSPGLPASVYTVRSDDQPLYRRSFTGTKVTSTDLGATTNAPDWNTVSGAFMIQGDLYVGHEDGSLTKQTFDGTTYDTPTNVITGDALVPQADWHSGDVPNLTSIFYYHGFLYFTLASGTDLYRRAFEPEEGLVGQLRSVTKLSKPAQYGAFVAGGKYFFAGKSGYLYSMKWGAAGPRGKVTAVSGPSKKYGSQNWRSKVAFVYQPAPSP
jgi:hypothetical protein